MEDVTNWINSAAEYIAVAVAFLTGLFADFKGYSRAKKIAVIAGGFLALVLVLTALQAMFG